MKSFLTPLLVFLFSARAFAQFKLSGKIDNYTGTEELKINIPLVYGYYKENSTTIPVAKNGTFSINLPIKTQKFADVIFKKTFYKLLITPNKTLNIALNENKAALKVIKGSSVAENKLMQKIDLEEYPFFMANDSAFKAFGFTELNNRVVLPYLMQCSNKVSIVNRSPISSKNKKLIAAELKYCGLNYLDDFAWNILKSRPVTDSLITEIFSDVSITPAVVPAGPQYYAFVRKYLGYMEAKAFAEIKQKHIKPNEPIPYFGISLDSANIIVNKYGKPYWRWVGSRKFLTDEVTEQFTYQQMVSLYYDKDLKQTEALANAFLEVFPKSIYSADIRKRVADLKGLKNQNETNNEIKVLANYRSVSSIYDVIKQFKGKVVYLDVWGTWCGPCKEEIKFIPQLKANFKNKDVVFVYLDMDEDENDAIWKEFIKVNALTGLHLRKSRQAIAPFWKELLANNPDKEESYPQYFIFDKNGNLSVSKALRPSNREQLYQQINTVLNKN